VSDRDSLCMERTGREHVQGRDKLIDSYPTHTSHQYLQTLSTRLDHEYTQATAIPLRNVADLTDHMHKSHRFRSANSVQNVNKCDGVQSQDKKLMRV